MKKKQTVVNKPTQRLRYEAPQVWCISIEAEGIIANSDSTGPTFGGEVGNGNTIDRQEVGLFSSGPGFDGSPGYSSGNISRTEVSNF